MDMKIYGEILFIGALTICIFLAKDMFVSAIITSIVCALLIEIIILIKKRIEKNKLTCNECFHFMKNDLYAKPKYEGFCCLKQTKLYDCKICSGFLPSTPLSQSPKHPE